MARFELKLPKMGGVAEATTTGLKKLEIKTRLMRPF
jgi:hypothetical protein